MELAVTVTIGSKLLETSGHVTATGLNEVNKSDDSPFAPHNPVIYAR